MEGVAAYTGYDVTGVDGHPVLVIIDIVDTPQTYPSAFYFPDKPAPIVFPNHIFSFLIFSPKCDSYENIGLVFPRPPLLL